MTIKAPAKINLYLNVGKIREDNFHEVQTLMIKVGLYDNITLSLEEDIKVTGMDWLKDEDNLAYKAAVALKEQADVQKGCLIDIEKNIPIAAGLGGGSSDCGGVLKGLNKLWDLNYPVEKLEKIGRNLGSDVNFFLQPGGGLARGKGEKIEFLEPEDKLTKKVLLINPEIEISTKKIYEAYPGGYLTEDEELDKITNNYLTGAWQKILKNDLENTVFREYPVLKDLKQRLVNWGLFPLLSGSGSSVFALFSDIEKANSVKSIIEEDFGYSAWILESLI
ncbi:MAG: 4-(cytidine 5'-diphospho)-2-C-methyl-D-erythritol kinase [Elusimicrobiota bacterium]